MAILLWERVVSERVFLNSNSNITEKNCKRVTFECSRWIIGITKTSKIPTIPLGDVSMD